MATATQNATGANGTVATDEAKGLAAKLVAASLDVEYVEKKGRNTQQNYNYAKAEDIAEAATKALLSRGVLAELQVIDTEEYPIRSKQGSDGLIVKVACELTVTDSESGESLSRRTMGSGSDYPGDKAIYKAMTGARKYAFIHLLGIPIGDDPEEQRDAPPTRRQELAPKLPAERVEQIIAAIKERKLTFAEIDLLLGSVGIDALRARSKKAARERIESLTPEQADALEAELTGADG